MKHGMDLNCEGKRFVCDHVSETIIERLLRNGTIHQLCVCPTDYSEESKMNKKEERKDNTTGVYKKGEKDNVNNNKPMTIFSCISKVLEKYNKLIKFVNTNNILYNEQHGFRNKWSMRATIYEWINSILSLTDKKQESIEVLINLSKAFDIVDHKQSMKNMAFEICEHL
ncbi:uncharacterized protein LOC124606538 [Schistocerca americana]|uniref:uncharacterized protein LOC124606538 n=1 Tax=Schistocerca americana TaxID=7009 RepID=UPI001F4FE244|nr:uncharacterized protein LOC124606538 [Schistocerca americana]